MAVNALAKYTTPGNKNLKIIIDKENIVLESDETNNDRSVSLNIK